MTCRSVRRLLPLAARPGDLAGAKAAKVAAHVAGCAACRSELEAYRSAIDGVRRLDEAAARSWSAPAWSAAVRRAIAGTPRPAAARPKLALRTALVAAAGILLVAVIGLVFFLNKSPLRRGEVLEARAAGAPPEISAPAAYESAPGETPDPAPSPAPTPQPAAGRISIRPSETALLAAGKTTPSPAPVERALTGAAATPPSPAPAQDVVSATFVSRETGLQIVWFFDRNFDWKKGEGQ